MRYLIGELLGFLSVAEVETALTLLADSVLAHLARDTELLVVALGKYGGAELAVGSDLDLLVIAPESAADRSNADLDRLRRALHHGGPLGPVFAVDLRLRPHGNAGPPVTTLPALAAYHRGEAQPWEKQLLTRARVVAGPSALAEPFREWCDRLLYAEPPTPAEETAMAAMRTRIERERDVVAPPARAFKTGPGGLIETEFFVQTLQMRHGLAHPKIREPGTRAALKAFAAEGILAPGPAARLLENYEFLKKVEFALRRDANQAVSILPAAPAERAPLARWLGFSSEGEFWAEHVRRMGETRQLSQGSV